MTRFDSAVQAYPLPALQCPPWWQLTYPQVVRNVS